MPEPVGDERWDVLFAGLAEHLARPGSLPQARRVRCRLRNRRSVSDPSPLLDRAGIEDAFRRLGERLARRGVVADLYVFGGAAMALAYDSRRATRYEALARQRARLDEALSAAQSVQVALPGAFSPEHDREVSAC